MNRFFTPAGLFNVAMTIAGVTIVAAVAVDVTKNIAIKVKKAVKEFKEA